MENSATAATHSIKSESEPRFHADQHTAGWKRALVGCQNMGAFRENELFVAALDEDGRYWSRPNALKGCLPRRYQFFAVGGLPTGPCPDDSITVDLMRLVSQGGQYLLTLR